MTAGPVTGVLTVPRRAALAAISALVAAASLVSFAESYRGLFLWASRHGLHGTWAVLWPLQVDVFIAVGELALFVGLADRWPPRSRAAAWTVTVLGLAVSVAGNVGHVAGHSLTVRTTAAVPPLAAAAALAVGLGVLKRVVGAHPEAVPAPVPERTSRAPSGAAPGTGANRARARSGSNGRAQPGTRAPVTPETAELAFAPVLAEGTVPSLRAVRRELHVGTERAPENRDHLPELTTART